MQQLQIAPAIRQTAIPCVVMRGGTSKGLYFLATDLPADTGVRDRVLLAGMGSPDHRQIDGMGGADTLTSKVAIVSRSSRPEADVDYLFAQVSVDEAMVDTNPSCGNILAGIGPFAIECGLVRAESPETRLTIHNVNTRALIDVVVQTPDGVVTYAGDAAIDGVPGTAAPVLLEFRDVVGSKTGSLLPTGQVREEIEGVETTCIDVAMPMVLMAAASFGKSGHESKDELNADQAMLDRIEKIRRIAGERMGLGDVSGKVIPKVGLLAAPEHGGTLSSRYFTPRKCHAAHAVTGGICVASCALLEGSVAQGLASLSYEAATQSVRIEHPSGAMQIEMTREGHGPQTRIITAGLVSTCRRLFEGRVFVPGRIWDGRQ